MICSFAGGSVIVFYNRRCCI